jgi:hypothetical protein
MGLVYLMVLLEICFIQPTSIHTHHEKNKINILLNPFHSLPSPLAGEEKPVSIETGFIN